MGDEEQIAEFRPSSVSLLVLALFSATAAVTVTALEDKLLGSGSLPLVVVLTLAAVIPLGRAVANRKHYVIKVADTWMSGPGKKPSNRLTLSREQVVALRHRDGQLIIDAGEDEPIVIPLRYYSDACRLESALYGFVSGVRPWIIRRTA